MNQITKKDHEALTYNQKFEAANSMVGSIAMHFKGDKYLVVGVAQCVETQKYVVVYRALYGECQLYTREVEDFYAYVGDREDNKVGNGLRFEGIHVTSMKERV